MRFLLSLMLMVAAAAAAQAQQMPGPVGSPEGVWRAQIHWVPLDIAGTRYLLYTQICRPAGEASARVVVIAHGVPPSALIYPRMKPLACDSEAARWFLERGFIVVASMRRGFGETGGYPAENFRRCDDADYFTSGLQSVRDISATVDYAASLPFARPQGVVVVGQSAGGWGALAYDAMPHPRVTAFVSMAGGRGGHFQEMPDSNCRPQLLVDAAGRLARTATTPMLWVYSENDSFFAPALAAAMYAAYTQNGGKGEFEQLGPFGQDGHRLFVAPGGSQIWGPLVERYLAGRPAQ
jgi:pimeloyl-ACP methyl ester carboxylesterase